MTAQARKLNSTEDLQREIQRLNRLLEEEKNLRQEAQETLEAIRTGAVDGIVRSTPEGDQVFILKDSDQPYRNLIEEMNEGALLVSEAGTILYCNAGFARIVDAPLEGIMGSNIRDWITPNNSFTKEAFSGKPTSSKKIFDVAFKTTKKKLIPTQLSINKISLASINASAFIVTDLTPHMEKDIKRYTANLEKEIAERKKAQEALKERTLQLEQTQKKLEENAVLLEETASKMENLADQRLNQLKEQERLVTIGQTAGMVGHDIRNPLQGIVGDLFFIKENAATLPEGEAKKDIQQSLTNIEENVFYIEKIVADLQDYAKPLKPTTQKVDLQNAVEKSLEGTIIPLNVNVDISIPKDFPTLRSNEPAVRRIISNLILNAVQAMPHGGTLSIRATCKEDKAIISVSDTGVGIPDDIKPKLFKPLFTTKSKGQGLGLAVVKKLADDLGLTITFESQEGKGTKFVIKLPITQ